MPGATAIATLIASRIDTFERSGDPFARPHSWPGSSCAAATTLRD
jgi:hypothetical protein